jgi:hypothetical protein
LLQDKTSKGNKGQESSCQGRSKERGESRDDDDKEEEDEEEDEEEYNQKEVKILKRKHKRVVCAFLFSAIHLSL